MCRWLYASFCGCSGGGCSAGFTRLLTNQLPGRHPLLHFKILALTAVTALTAVSSRRRAWMTWFVRTDSWIFHERDWRQTNSILLSPETGRCVSYRETHVITTCPRTFTLSVAVAFISPAVNYCVASLCFPDMQCDLLHFLFSQLFYLVSPQSFMLSKTISGFRVLRKQNRKKRMRKRTYVEKKARK